MSMARAWLPLPVLVMLVLAPPAPAAPTEGTPHAIPIPPEAETVGGDACMPERAALAMVEKMAKAMGKDADILAEAEEDLKTKAADCLDGDDDVVEISNGVARHGGGVAHLRRGNATPPPSANPRS